MQHGQAGSHGGEGSDAAIARGAMSREETEADGTRELSLLQMQRGEIIKCRQIWQDSQKCKDVSFVLIHFPSVLILFPFARCHV